MAQYMHVLSATNMSLPSDLWLPVTDKVEPLRSWQVDFGPEWEVSKGLSFTLEGYYKKVKNILDYKDNQSFFDFSQSWDDKLTSGTGESYGVEMLLHRKVGNLSGWIGYTLSKSMSQFDDINNGEPFRANNDRRHDASVFVSYKISSSIDANMVWAFGSGKPVTLANEKFYAPPMPTGMSDLNSVVESYSKKNGYTMPSFHRLDIGANFNKENRIGKRVWSVGVMNVYGRQNPFFLYFPKPRLMGMHSLNSNSLACFRCLCHIYVILCIFKHAKMKKTAFAYFGSPIVLYFQITFCGLAYNGFRYAGCEKELDYDLGNAGNLPVLYSFFQPDSPMDVSLSKSVSILSAKPFELYGNAMLELSKNGKYLARVDYPQDKLSALFPAYTFSVGDTVSIDVMVDGNKVAGASAYIPAVIPIEKVDTVRVLRKQPDGRFVPMMKTIVRFTDPLAQANYYQLQLFHKYVGSDGVSVIDTIDYIKDDRVFYSPEIGASSFGSIDFQGLFTDTNIDGKDYGLVVYLPISYFTKSPEQMEPQFLYRLFHVDALYFDFLRARIIELSNQNSPLFNNVKLPTNVVNGFGVVAALSPSNYSLPIL
jgi:hypothetical protein